MRILIASDSEPEARQVRELLGHHGLDCPTGHVVPLELAADRASRLVPQLVVLVLPPEPAVGLEVLRETRNTLPNVHLLVVGPATDARMILRTLHEGADEFLDESALDTELASALARFKSRESLPAERQQAGKVVAVLGPSGGSGSSTLAANLSVALAQQYGECGLIDLRLAAGDLASMLDLNPAHSMADLCAHLARLDQSMFEQFFARHRSGVCLLAAPIGFADVQRVTSRGVRRTLAMSRVRFPFVVLDLDNAFDVEQVEALWQADTVLLVLRLDYISVRNARRVLDNLVRLGIGLEAVRLVVNGYRQRKQLSVAQAEEALGMKIAHYVPHDPATVNQAINKGVPVLLYYPSAKVSKSIRALTAAFNGRAPT